MSRSNGTNSMPRDITENEKVVSTGGGEKNAMARTNGEIVCADAVENI